jgi:hypothetical protein
MTLDLRKLDAQTAYFDTNGRPTMQFQIFWQQTIEAIVAQETIQDQALADIQTALTNAGIALATAQASMPAVAPLTVYADDAGTVLTDELPLDVPFKRYAAGVDVTADSAWSMTVLTGSATASIGAATGVLQITALGSSTTFQIESVKDDLTLTTTLLVTKDIAAPPSSGSGGGSASSDTSFTSIDSTTHEPISDELTVTAGTGGVVDLTASLLVSTARTAAGVWPVWGIWQWFDGAVWVDQGSEVESDPDTEVTDSGDGYAQINRGVLTITASKTGLAPASSHKFRLTARNDTGTRLMNFSGTASAVGS